MARRSEHSKEELRELAIVSGLQLADKEGISGFGARRVSAMMGYTVGTLYHIFGSLDEFVLHVNGRTLDEWHEAISRVSVRGKTGTVQALAKAYIRFVRQHYGRWSLLFGYSLTPDTKIPAWYQEKIGKLFSVVEEAVLPHVNNNRGKAGQTARVLWASVHGICVLSMSGKLDLTGTESAEVMTKTLVKYLLKGMET